MYSLLVDDQKCCKRKLSSIHPSAIFNYNIFINLVNSSQNSTAQRRVSLDLQAEGGELGVDALVEDEHDGVVLLDGAAEHGLHGGCRHLLISADQLGNAKGHRQQQGAGKQTIH